MSRAKEIQEKLDLQAKLQGSFGANTSKVLSWLDKDAAGGSADTTDLNNSKAAFFTLPVMQTGSGLNLSLATGSLTNKDDIHTVGEFIQSEKKVSSLSKKRRPNHTAQTTGIHRISKDDTRAMVALKRKMRQTQRESVRQSVQAQNVQNSDPKGRDHEPEDDSDSDEDRPVSKVSKKAFGLLFNNKKTSKR